MWKSPLPKEARPWRGSATPPTEARVNRMRLAPPAGHRDLIVLQSVPSPSSWKTLPGAPSKGPRALSRPALAEGKQERETQQPGAGWGGGGTAVTAWSRGADELEEPSPSFHLEARRLWSVAFRYPGEPAFSLPPPCICGSESFAPPLRSDFRSLLQRSGSLFGPAGPVGWPGLVGGLRQKIASVSGNPQRPAGLGRAAGGQM